MLPGHHGLFYFSGLAQNLGQRELSSSLTSQIQVPTLNEPKHSVDFGQRVSPACFFILHY